MDSLDRRQGLSSEQVAQRVRDGLSNADEGIKTKTEKQIILENTFTFLTLYWRCSFCWWVRLRTFYFWALSFLILLSVRFRA